MSKLLETLLDILRDFSKIYLPPLYGVIRRGLDLQSLSVSLVAHYSRRFGGRAILATGLLASAYALYLFALQAITPEAPKASHDVVLKNRLSSPAPAGDVLIVDIDERTLAALSDRHGRWPWPRDVLADGVQKVLDQGARAVLFNVMLSDPDKAHPDADAAMDATAQMNRPIAFPLIRLNPKNDGQSQLRIAQVPGVVAGPQAAPEQTLAAILPMFGSMHDRLGVANQKPDADGIVRKYPLLWAEGGYRLPTLVRRTLDLGGADLAGLPEQMSLNWRNKKGRYTRVSFSDLLDDQLPPESVARLKGAFVVLSLSAPGLGQTKPTSVASIEDDGEILATALDDALHRTYLRMMPGWAALVINLLTIWGLVWLSIKPFRSGLFNKAFVFIQSSLGGITLLSASYTNYLIDLSDSMSFGLSVFAVIKLIQSMDDRWSRARPGFRRLRGKAGHGQVLVLSYLEGQLRSDAARVLQQGLERIVGLVNVVRVDDLFGGESFLKGACAGVKCLVVHAQGEQADAIAVLLDGAGYQAVRRSGFMLAQAWDPENKVFAAELAPKVLDCSVQLLQQSWDDRPRNS